MAVEIWLGALSPEAYEISLPNDVEGIDLENVESAVFVVLDPSGVESEWSAGVVYDEEADMLRLTHVFDVEESELTKAGWWTAFALMTLTGGGTIRSKPRSILVRGKFEVVPPS